MMELKTPDDILKALEEFNAGMVEGASFEDEAVEKGFKNMATRIDIELSEIVETFKFTGYEDDLGIFVIIRISPGGIWARAGMDPYMRYHFRPECCFTARESGADFGEKLINEWHKVTGLANRA